jgi:hypothetical protein
MEGLLSRRTYAATDRIVCDFRLGGAFMGQEITRESGPIPVEMFFIATGPVKEVVLLRDSEPIRKWIPEHGEQRIRIEDSIELTEAKGHYFYARMQQTDTNLCWSSPVWVD